MILKNGKKNARRMKIHWLGKCETWSCVINLWNRIGLLVAVLGQKLHGQSERVCLTNIADLASCIVILLQNVVMVYVINLTPVLNNSIRE